MEDLYEVGKIVQNWQIDFWLESSNLRIPEGNSPLIEKAQEVARTFFNQKLMALKASPEKLPLFESTRHWFVVALGRELLHHWEEKIQ